MNIKNSSFYLQIAPLFTKNLAKKNIVLNDLPVTVVFSFSLFEKIKGFFQSLCGRASHYTSLQIPNKEGAEIACYIKTNALAQVLISSQFSPPDVLIQLKENKEKETLLIDIPKYASPTLKSLVERGKKQLTRLETIVHSRRGEVLEEFCQRKGKLITKAQAFFEESQVLAQLTSQEESEWWDYLLAHPAHAHPMHALEQQRELVRTLREEEEHFKMLELSHNEKWIQELAPLLLNLLQKERGGPWWHVSSKECAKHFGNIQAVDNYIPFYLALLRGMERFQPDCFQTLKNLILDIGPKTPEEVAFHSLIKFYFT